MRSRPYAFQQDLSHTRKIHVCLSYTSHRVTEHSLKYFSAPPWCFEGSLFGLNGPSLTLIVAFVSLCYRQLGTSIALQAHSEKMRKDGKQYTPDINGLLCEHGQHRESSKVQM